MKVEDYFKNYPGSDQCFQTADGLIFHKDGDAMLHAKSLKDKAVKRFTASDSEIKETVIAKTATDIVGKVVTMTGEAEPGTKLETMTTVDNQDSDISKTKVLETKLPELVPPVDKEVGKEAPQIVDKTGDNKPAYKKADDVTADKKVVNKKAATKSKAGKK